MIDPRVPPEARCIIDDCPCIDHAPLRYVLRAWIKHRALQLLSWPGAVKRRHSGRNTR